MPYTDKLFIININLACSVCIQRNIGLFVRYLSVQTSRSVNKKLEFTSYNGDSSYRLNFDLGKKNKIHHRSQKEHVKISKIAKFGREML